MTMKNADGYAPLKTGVGAFEVAAGIDGAVAFANFEVELRTIDVAGRADERDGLALAHAVAFVDEQLLVVGVGGDETVRVTDQEQVAVTGELVAGVNDDAVVGGLDRGAW